ncbi:MAG: hypothetical protein AAFV85_20070 [Cyanobacteria bacterium J06634_6]
MANSSSHLSSGSDMEADMDNAALSKTQAELLQSILDTEQSSPWVAAETAGAYDETLAAAGEALEFSDEEAASGWQGLSATLSQIWGDATGESSMLARLQAKFANRLPSDVLAMIGEKAQQVVQSGQPMVDQLITCVQDGFENMATADLQVMARPMAFAMRGNSAEEFVDATISSVRVDEWSALSPIEQARLSLAAARYAISQADEA